MTNLGKQLRDKLSQQWFISNPVIVREQTAQDKTRKFALRFDDGVVVECVIIVDEKRRTLCISTQAGCKRKCVLCATGKMGFKRNLTQAEILDQIIVANRVLAPKEHITHLVFMGMGEPFDNFDTVLAALRIIHADHGMCVSPGRTTISTVGVLEGIERLGKEGQGEGLAISLHASDDETRKKLIPHARSVSIDQIIQAAAVYARVTGDKVTFEYVMIKGVNCFPADGKRLAKLLSQLPSKINLIPCNQVADSPYRMPGQAEIDAFMKELYDSPVIVTVRKSKGRDIMAACGQLAGSVPPV
ncbi:MAG: 23S rRNA (adenine(2503)-C(2))-methyltransferase [Candidatus Raymondbacteria bacterium RIFOXYD12_FULL_49_13]|uniref:23S rRNA (Adenine(2503)-C(2))-methyltransferase n=1 Tax=Candidatus Raymondbacteria bacterium RIFOXYD12_FULL_49_13 TaxID=1817890 RepID=A0A1F7F789_UNCRA|nr:MAG: 23S rRNA (adenine(2503)-C(2))-methyltransferase [Candidatus Raymondbacteria bacterium RIFOXYD12_FULL_49_13]